MRVGREGVVAAATLNTFRINYVMLIRVSTACPQTDRPYITHWHGRVEKERERGWERETACSIVAIVAVAVVKTTFQMLWCGPQLWHIHSPLTTPLPPSIPLCHPPPSMSCVLSLGSCNASKHFNQTGCKKRQRKDAQNIADEAPAAGRNAAGQGKGEVRGKEEEVRGVAATLEATQWRI